MSDRIYVVQGAMKGFRFEANLFTIANLLKLHSSAVTRIQLQAGKEDDEGVPLTLHFNGRNRELGAGEFVMVYLKD